MKALWWIGGSLVALTLILAAIFYGDSMTTPAPKKGIGLGEHSILAEVEFGDFSRMQILKLEQGQLID